MDDEHEQHAMELGVDMHRHLDEGAAVEVEHATRPERRRSERALSVTVSFDSEADRRAFGEKFEIPMPPTDDAQCWNTAWPLDDVDRPALF